MGWSAHIWPLNASADCVRASDASDQLQDESGSAGGFATLSLTPASGSGARDGRPARERFLWGAQNWVVRAPDFRSELRGAVYRGDGPAVVALVGDQLLPGDALQLIGDGLVVALALQTQGAADLAVACVRALRERGWDGDDELADQLGALLGTGPTPLLRPLPVDLEELAGVLEGDPTFGGGRLDLLTGQVWPQAAIDYARPPRL